MVSTSAWHATDASSPGSIPGEDRHGIFGVKIWLLTLGTVFPCESENHVNVGPVSIWDVKEPLRTTRTLAVTTFTSLQVQKSRLSVNVLKKTD